MQSSALLHCLFLLKYISYTYSQDECTLRCINGECKSNTFTLNGNSFHLNSCECNEGWGGVYCDEVGRTCPDGRTCFNGADCTPIEGKKMDSLGTPQYYCDCAKAYKFSAFAGEMCESPATAICQYGTAKNTASFCTNGGACEEVVTPDSNGVVTSHGGCSCPDGFTGDHCEYLKGTEPAPLPDHISKVEDKASKSNNTPKSSSAAAVAEAPPKKSKSHTAIRVISIFLFAFVCIGTVYGLRMHLLKKREARTPKPVINLAAEAGVDSSFEHNGNKVGMNGEIEEELHEVDII